MWGTLCYIQVAMRATDCGHGSTPISKAIPPAAYDGVRH